jgi:1-acyl-sn-glycerol-3-phosphate acyltransferase
MVAVPLNPHGTWVGRIERIWGRMILALCGVKVRVEGADRRFDAPAYLVMANHTSHFDVIALCASVPIYLRAVAKRELGYIPIFGWVLWMGAAIMIDRGDRQKAIASIERAGRAIRQGRTVLMFPEGTRTPPGVLGPLKKGPFHLATSAKVPILPIGVIGTGQVLLPGDWRIRPGPVVVRIGDPIPTEGVPDDDAGRSLLMERVADALKALMATGDRAREAGASSLTR